MRETLQYLADQWFGYKIWLTSNIGITNDAMHVHISLLILFFTALVLRKRPDSPWCWLIVLIAELFNEYTDLQGNAPGEATIDAGVHDLYNTMFWPTVILVLGRLLFPPRAKEGKAVETSSGDLADQPFEEAPTI